MDRNFLKQSIRRELDYYKDGLFNEDEDEYWERAWAAPDDDDSMAENGFLNVAMAHLQGDECDEIVLLGTEYGYHQPDYDSYIDIGAAFVNDMSTGFLQTEGSEEDWEQLKDDIVLIYPTPTVWSSHVYIALDEAGTAGIDALLDEDIQRLAWEKHGFRTGVYDTPTDAAHFGVSGIAEELTQVAPMPDANTMNRIIKALS